MSPARTINVAKCSFETSLKDMIQCYYLSSNSVCKFWRLCEQIAKIQNFRTKIFYVTALLHVFIQQQLTFFWKNMSAHIRLFRLKSNYCLQCLTPMLKVYPRTANYRADNFLLKQSSIFSSKVANHVRVSGIVFSKQTNKC